VGGTVLPDSDEDGLCDAADPCPLVPNTIGGSTFGDPFNVSLPWLNPLVLGCFADVYNPTSTPGAPNATNGNDRFYRFTTSSCATHINGQLESFLNELPPVSIYLLDASGVQLNNWGSVPGDFVLPIGETPVSPSTTYYLVIETPMDLDPGALGISIGQTTTDPDSDGDGICDNVDNCPFAIGQVGSPCTDLDVCTINEVIDANCNCTGAYQDNDLDGICDVQDNCPGVMNTVQEDLDGDGAGDACDSCPFVGGGVGSPCNDGQTCTTNDVLTATCSCEGTPVSDSDGDGLCDAEDPCPLQPGPCEGDGDGIPDANDNCPTVSNADQADADGDGKGDACDVCPTVANPGTMGCPTTIHHVKTGMVAVGSYVRISNTLVTGVGSDGFFTQVVASDPGYTGPFFSGLFVHTGPGALLASVNVGARVHVDGTVALQQSRIQLDDVVAVIPVNAGPEAQPAPQLAAYADVITGGALADELESVIISVGLASVSSLNAPDGELTLTDAMGNTLVADDYLYLLAPPASVGDVYTSVRGILTTISGASKLEPRNIEDYTPGCSSNTICDDNDPCTVDLCVDGFCTHTPFADSDGDGVCDATDNCPSLPGQIGSACQAGPCNAPGVIDINCTCVVLDGTQQGIWTAKASCPIAPQAGFSFSIGNKGYIGAGVVFDELGEITPSSGFWEFDPATNTWSQKADVPSSRTNASGFSIGNKGYMLGGSSTTGFLSDLWSYDPLTNTWTQKADYPYPGLTAWLTTIATDDKAYTLIFSNVGAGATLLYTYDPAQNNWTNLSDFPGGLRYGMSGFSIAGKVYVGCGDGASGPTNDLWEFDPVTTAWNIKAPLPSTPRYYASSFSLGSRGYIGTGNSINGNQLADLWQYTPATDSWLVKSPLPGVARQIASAFSIGNKGYIGLGFALTNGFNNDLWEFDPGVSCVPCTPCDDGSSCTINDAYDAHCECAGTPVPDGTLCDVNAQCLAGSCQPACTENVTIELRTDLNSQQVSWAILDQNTNTTLCSGGGYPPNVNTPITENCCLPAGCYRLRVSDSGGDGFVSGGYQLRESGANGRRIIDDMSNFTTGSSSALASTYENGAFCVPIGSDRPIFTSCDKLDWVGNQFIVASENTAVSAQFGTTNTTSGYEFWFFDPNGSYSFRRFRSHATSDGTGTGALRACHFKLNGWINSVATPHLPANHLLNVRIRGRVAGNNLPFGPACQFKIDAVRAACPLVKLQDDPANTSDYSCGVSRVFGGSNSAANKVVAAPPKFIPAVASSNVRYQFRFRLPGEFPAPGSCIVRPVQMSPTLHLNWTTGERLKCNTQYLVDVRVSKNGGATWCVADGEITCNANPTIWGKVCQVNITTSTFCPSGGTGNTCGNGVLDPGEYCDDGNLVNGDGCDADCSLTGAAQGGSTNFTPNGAGNSVSVYPNPNHGDQLFVSMTDINTTISTVTMDVYDMTGKRLVGRTIAVQDGFVNQAVELNGELAGGLYLVNFTAGDQTFSERLVVQP